MDTGVNEFPGLDPQEVAFLEGVRARRLQRSRERMLEVSPWLVTVGGLVGDCAGGADYYGGVFDAAAGALTGGICRLPLTA